MMRYRKPHGAANAHGNLTALASSLRWFEWLTLPCFAALLTLFSCSNDCTHSMTILWIPEDRVASVISVVASDGCGVDDSSDHDAGYTYHYIWKTGDGHCHVTVEFNDGSPAFKVDAAMDPNGCLLPQPIHVPEKG